MPQVSAPARASAHVLDDSTFADAWQGGRVDMYAHAAAVARTVLRQQRAPQAWRDDIVAHVTAKVWAHHGSAPASPTRWVARVTLNALRSMHRDAQRSASRHASLALAERVSDGETPATLFERADTERATRARLGAGLQRLAAHHRAVLVSVYFAGLSVAETAITLDIAPNHCRVRIHRALNALRRIMGAHT